MIRTYLDWITGLPWSTASTDNLDLAQAAADPRRGPLRPREGQGAHPGVPGGAEAEAATSKGPILCFVGPPGRRQDLARPVDRAGPRPQVRPHLAGRRARRGGDPGPPAHLRRRAARPHHPGHLAGRHHEPGLHARRDRQDRAPTSAATRPRRSSRCWTPSRTSPSATTTSDVPFDLSKVLFITTANMLDTIRRPSATGWRSCASRATRARRSSTSRAATCIPKQMSGERPARQRHRLHRRRAPKRSSQDYTREAGVRNLEREIGPLLPQGGRRGSPRRRPKPVDGHAARSSASSSAVRSSSATSASSRPGRRGDGSGLDRRRRRHPLRRGARRARARDGSQLTGQLGDVMKESAQAALTYVRSRAERARHRRRTSSRSTTSTSTSPRAPSRRTGPRPGVTMVTAHDLGLLRAVPVRRDVAMTGEITLRGEVLPIGGVKEKVLAARRAGSKTVILPQANESDLEEVPARAPRGHPLRIRRAAWTTCWGPPSAPAGARGAHRKAHRLATKGNRALPAAAGSRRKKKAA